MRGDANLPTERRNDPAVGNNGLARSVDSRWLISSGGTKLANGSSRTRTRNNTDRCKTRRQNQRGKNPTTRERARDCGEPRTTPSWDPSPQCLEVNLHSDLADPRGTRRRDLTEITRREVANRVVELGMIENIEELGPDIHRDPFSDMCVLKK